jgi:F-type H+/Na+-transporting ATPase subunit alpha
VASIFAGTRGILDKLQVAAVSQFERYLHEHLRTHHAPVLETILKTGKLEGATESELEAACRTAQERYLKEHPEAAIG